MFMLVWSRQPQLVTWLNLHLHWGSLRFRFLPAPFTSCQSHLFSQPPPIIDCSNWQPSCFVSGHLLGSKWLNLGSVTASSSSCVLNIVIYSEGKLWVGHGAWSQKTKQGKTNAQVTALSTRKGLVLWHTVPIAYDISIPWRSVSWSSGCPVFHLSPC